MTPVVTASEMSERAVRARASEDARRDKLELKALGIEQARCLGGLNALRILRDLRWLVHQGEASPLSMLVPHKRISHYSLDSEAECGDDANSHGRWYLQQYCTGRDCTITFEPRKKHRESSREKRTLIVIAGPLLHPDVATQLNENWELQLERASFKGRLHAVRTAKALWSALRTESWSGGFKVERDFPRLSYALSSRIDEAMLKTWQRSMRREDQANAWLVQYFRVRGFEVRLSDSRGGKTSVLLKYPKPIAEAPSGQ